MKRILITISLLFIALTHLKAQILPCTGYPRYRNFHYYYDDNGNREYREFIFVCPTGPPEEPLRLANPDSLFALSLKDSTLIVEKNKLDSNTLIKNSKVIVESIYPNPTHDNFIIKFNEFIVNARLEIYDASGRIYFEEYITGKEFNINISLLSSNQYIIVVKTQDGKVYTDKIVKI